MLGAETQVRGADMVDNDTAAARSEVAVKDLRLSMLEASGPHATGAVWAILLHFATQQMDPPQYDRWCRFALSVLQRAEA